MACLFLPDAMTLEQLLCTQSMVVIMRAGGQTAALV
jgi:hypothetical protein